MHIKSPIDPFFKKRIIIVRQTHSKKPWRLISLFIIFSVIVYFFSDRIQDITSEILTAQEEILKQSSQSTAELNPLESPPIQAVADNVKATEKTKEAAVIAETVENLLTKARAQIAKTQYTSPKGDNAYETYQTLFKVAPEQAEPILDAIVAWYFKEATQYLKSDQVIQPENGNAYNMYQQLREMAPQHQSTQILLKQIIDVLIQRAQSQMAKYYYTRPKDNNAANTYQHILKISPDNMEAQNGLKKIVDKYYRRAVRAQKQGRIQESLDFLERALQVAPDDPILNQLKTELGLTH
ncbi:tetratricopeptide repeat domain protein [Candidatus Thiomargarita nelsonii]|uniref:Tetratricopeptide repeat domain protein n=1 Tax=Candidatus Thiomargarita nelsonii TaxID=1003181 RepID=A0A176S599_9GAMM|nr:tetratricopeptide repeat domain protein [Candidatus Thiomargarita nelsonii]